MCNDGNYGNGDGCNYYCLEEAGYTCTWDSNTNLHVCTDVCGDGTYVGGTPAISCDDSNTVPGDGCDENCNVEQYYY